VRNALDQIELVRERERLYAELEETNTQLAENVEQLQQVCQVLEDQATVIQADLDRAEVIQRALLPQEPPAIEGWCIETLYRPGSSVGGDFYDAVVLDEDHLGLVIADAAGHGVAAAMLSVLFKLRLKQIDSDGRALRPHQVLERLNGRLFDTLSAPGAFITAVYILLDLRTGSGRLASAGHPPCILCSPGGATRMLARSGPALGLATDAHYEEHAFQLQAGDRLLLYTDGVLEGGPDSPNCEKIARSLVSGDDRAELLGSCYRDAIRGVSGDRDDITMLLLERTAGASHFDDAAPAEDRTTSEPCGALAQLRQGEAGNEAFISIVGSVTWLCSQALLDCADKLLQQYDRLILDLGTCEHIDSTCLGTLHEIVSSTPDNVVLQDVPAGVRQLFDELSMTQVLEHISAETRPLPEPMVTIDGVKLDPQQQGARILRAHESLAALSEENREQFRDVVDSLRADLHGDD
jgi:serine phosphatase RsbU (regulator of sigma subunit)/ABC-type transporter Mla MlaB component